MRDARIDDDARLLVERSVCVIDFSEFPAVYFGNEVEGARGASASGWRFATWFAR